MRKRIELAPFTCQVNHKEYFERWVARLQALKNAREPVALTNALNITTAAVAQRPTDRFLREKLAALYEQTGQPAQALEQWRLILENHPQFQDAMYEMGVLLDQTGRSAEAEALLKQALAVYPDKAEILSALGLAVASQGRPAEALEYYRQALHFRQNLRRGLCKHGAGVGSAGKNQ